MLLARWYSLHGYVKHSFAALLPGSLDFQITDGLTSNVKSSF